MRGRSIRVIGIILVLFVCMFGLSGKGVHVAAQDTAASGDKIYGDYSYQVLSDGNISISKYNGNASEVHVPEMIDGKKVTEIGKDAFENNICLNKVYLPKYLRAIGVGAFYNCYKLCYVSICGGLETIGMSAFVSCNFSNISIPDTVKMIGKGAFSENVSLEEVRLPKNLTVIDEFLFQGCNKLKSIYIPNSVKKIGFSAFASCRNLYIIKLEKIYYEGKQFVFIPTNIEEIEDLAFYDCPSIKNLVFLNSDCWIDHNTTTANIYGYKYSSNTDAKYLTTIYQYTKQFNKSFTEFVPMKELKLSSENLEILVNKQRTKKILLSSNPSGCTINDVYWTSSNDKIAKVDQQGNVTALSVGNTIITARSVDGSDLIKICKVSIKEAITSLKLSKSKVSLNMSKNKSMLLSIQISPKSAKNRKVSWKSSNSKVVCVNSRGMLTAKAPGIAKIIASAEGISVNCEVIVTPTAVKELRVSKQTINTITLKWKKVSGVTGYSIYRYDINSKKYKKLKDTKSTSYTVSKINGSKGRKLEDATSYSFKITPYITVNGKNNYGGDTKIKTATSPKRPELIKVKRIKKNGVNLSWRRISRVSGYMVYMSTKKTSGYKCIATLKGGNKVQYSKYGLTQKKGYYFKIKAYKKIGKVIIKGEYSSRKFIKM